MGWLSWHFGGGGREGTNEESGAHLTQQEPTPGMKTAKDPVCGMEVFMSKAAAISVYHSKTYYFCAPGCKKTFDQEPAKYIGGGGHQMAGHGGGDRM